MEHLEGRVAFITGGASGLGLGMARAFAAEGMRLVLADIDKAELERVVSSLSADVLALELDVTDRDSWAAAKQAALAHFDVVDLLCNNAGIAPDGREFADMPPANFDRVIATNLTGVFNGVSAFAADLRTRGEGHIVNTASMAGLMANARLGAYTTAKFAVVGLSEVLRVELAPSGVGVTVFCPGLVRTRLAESTRAQGGDVADELSMAAGMDPLDAAQAVVRAVRDNSLYAISHSGYRPHVAARVERLLGAFDGDAGSSFVPNHLSAPM